MTPELMEAGARIREEAEKRKAANVGLSGGRAASYSRVVVPGELELTVVGDAIVPVIGAGQRRVEDLGYVIDLRFGHFGRIGRCCGSFEEPNLARRSVEIRNRHAMFLLRGGVMLRIVTSPERFDLDFE